MTNLKIHPRNIWIFLLCAVLVIIIQFIILQPVLQYRLFNSTEDWPYLVQYHILGSNFLAQLIYVWKNVGLHTSAQIFYIGILSNFLGFNYSAYQVVNVVLKAIATLSLFPLVLVLFKNSKLAFLATILFGISSATAGSFLWIVKGSEYIGIMLMNLFLITYYFVILKNSKKLLLLSSFLFLAAYLMAPPRMFPLLLLVPMVEIYWLLKTRKLHNLKFSIIRAIIYILPVILISLPVPVSSCCPFTSRPPVLFKDIINGNWHNLLDPFAGIGWTLFTNDYTKDYWWFFGKLNFKTMMDFGSFLGYLLGGPLLVFTSLSLILSIIIVKKPVKFFLLIFGLNFVSNILMFFIANDNFHILENIAKINENPAHFIFTKYPTIMAIYIFVVAFAVFLEWRKNSTSNLLQAIWVGPIFAAIFLWPTWVIMGPLVNDWISVHWYFGIPAMGTTVSLAAVLLLFYEKFKHGKLSRIFIAFIIFGIIAIFYQSHKDAIAKQYLTINPEKVSLKDQQKLHGELIKSMGDSAKNGDTLIYLEIAGDLVNLRRTPEFYKEALVVNNYADWVHFRRGETLGCVEIILDKNILASAFQVKDREVGFVYHGRCLDKEPDGQGIIFVANDNHFYKMDNLYAFRIKNGEFVNIRDEIFQELGLFNL